MTARDEQRLTGIHPILAQTIRRVFDEMDAEKKPMFVVMGIRSTEEQKALYAKGRTAPGDIVTNCDGVKFKSPHQVHEDGFGYAVDCAFIGPQPFDPRWPWELYGSKLEDYGIIWGGRFHHPVDKDHAELRTGAST
jgi:hypothetical protein